MDRLDNGRDCYNGRVTSGGSVAQSAPITPFGLWWLTASVVIAACVSGIAPYDRITWLLEMTPLPVVLVALWSTRHLFPLTPIAYLGITIQCLGLVAGAAYTFPRVPLGEWLVDLLELSRNPYDRIGHFVQGLVPALVVREILIRRQLIQGDRLLPFVVVCVVMTFSATYEIVEWFAAITLGKDADDFLGMQGDPWDAQADMLCAFAGALFMLCCLPRTHDRQIAALSCSSWGELWAKGPDTPELNSPGD